MATHNILLLMQNVLLGALVLVATCIGSNIVKALINIGVQLELLRNEKLNEAVYAHFQRKKETNNARQI